MKAVVLKASATLSVIAMSLIANAAGPYYLSASGSGQNGAQLDNPGMWEDASGNPCTAFDELADYYVGSARTFSTRYGYQVATSVFPGGPLTIGDIAGAKNGFLYLRGDSQTTFPRGIKLARGQALNNYAQNASQSVSGSAEVLSSASTPFQIWSYYTGCKQIWSGNFSGLDTAGLLVGGGSCRDAFEFRATGDWTAYLGTVTVRKGVVSGVDSQVTYRPQTSSSFPGSLVMEADTVISPMNQNDVVTVKSFSIADGAKIVVPASASANAAIIVTNTFSCTGRVFVDASAVSSTKTDAGRTAVVLTVPDSSAMDESMFALDDTSTAANGCLKVSDNGNGTKSLKVVFYGIVTQTVSDGGSHQSRQNSSLLDNTHWSDGELPHANADYFVQPLPGACHLHTPLDTDYEFLGESLTFKGWCYFYSWGRTFTCKKLVIKNNSAVFMGNNGGVTAATRFEGGEICFESGSIRFASWNNAGRPVVLASCLTGAAELKLAGVTSTSYPRGETYISALNTNFLGVITVDLSNKDSNVIASDTVCQTLFVNDGRNVGGPLATFNYKALSLSQYARLVVTNAAVVTFEDGVNRGIFVGDVGRLVSAEGHTMCIKRPLTVDGNLRKEGAGVLELASEVGFLADGARTDAIPEDASKRLLSLKEGVLKVSHVDAVNGLTVQAANGTKLRLDLETTDSDLIAYGIRNTKTRTPFTVGDGASEVAIEIDLSHEPDFKSKTLAVMTVRQDCAVSVRDLVKVKKGANLHGFPMHFETVNEEIDGVASVVVKAVFERKGFIVSFR